MVILHCGVSPHYNAFQCENRVVANCIIEGARNARGGERLDSNSVATGSLHLFEYTAEAVRLVSTFNLR
jgi:hypothetical protein